eukprot:3603582-Pyramimonas_sp.AAC.1
MLMMLLLRASLVRRALGLEQAGSRARAGVGTRAGKGVDCALARGEVGGPFFGCSALSLRAGGWM